MKAIETTASIDKANRLCLDKPLPLSKSNRVRVIVLLPEDQEIEESQWLKAATNSPSFDFLKEPEEDLYTLEDGKPFQHEV